MTITLDRGRALTDSLVSYGAMTEGAGDPLDLGTQRYTSGANNVTWKSDQIGVLYLDLAGATPSFDLANPEFEDLVLPITILAVLSPEDSGEIGLALQTHDWNDDGSVYRGAALRVDTTGSARDIVASIGDGGGATDADERTFRWTDVVTIGVVSVFAVTILSNTQATLYLNGERQVAPITGGSGSGLSSAGTIFGHIGASTDTAQEYLGGVYTWAIWNRELTDQEHFDFASAPWDNVLLNLQWVEEGFTALGSGFPLPDPFLGPEVFNLARGYTTKPSWGEQQVIDWSNPLTDQLLVFGIMNEGGDRLPNDLVSGLRAESTNNVLWVDDADGVYADFQSTNPYIRLRNRQVVNMKAPCCTMVRALIPTGTPGGTFILTSNGIPADEGGSYAGLQFNYSSTAIAAAWGTNLGSTSGHRRQGSWAGETVLDKITTYSVNWPTTSAVDLTNVLFVDGVDKGLIGGLSGSAGGSVGYNLTGVLGKLGLVGGVGEHQLYMYAMWTRQLAPQEQARPQGEQRGRNQRL